MREVEKREVGGQCASYAIPPSATGALTSHTGTDIKGWLQLFLPPPHLFVRPLAVFLPSDGSSSTEAVVGFVSHTTVAPRWWWTGNLCSRFMLLLARWLYGRLDLLQRWPLPVLGSLVISSPASCLAKPTTCSPACW